MGTLARAFGETPGSPSLEAIGPGGRAWARLAGSPSGPKCDPFHEQAPQCTFNLP